jgi:predicted phosphodiesterase
MKSVILSDLHGVDPSFELDYLKQVEGIERFVFLGDYDTPKLFRQVLDYPGKNNIVLLGNHDFDFTHKLEINSPYLEYNSEHYFNQWQKNKKELAEALRMSGVFNGRKRGVRVVEKLRGKRIIYSHGALEDPNKTYTPEDRAHTSTWGRIVNPNEISANFSRMQEQNCWVLFRGHDHDFPGIWSIPFNGSSEQIIDEQGNITLDERRRYIVSVGCFRRGNYSLFNSSTLELRSIIAPWEGKIS